jgi:hypothetical protein
MKMKDITIRSLKRGYRFLLNKNFLNPACDSDRQSANDKIYNLLVADAPCMIARYGTTELIAVNNYLCITGKDHFALKLCNYIADKTHLPWWDKEHFKFMDVYSGIFPPTQQIAERFSQLYLKETPEIDLLGSFQYYEKFMPLRKDVQKTHLEALYPFFVERPWTAALKGKKVLIIHPFEDTIKQQYAHRENLFEHPDVLPEFELITLKAVQSAAGIEVPFKDWFEALDYMKEEISKIDFDICILGCGAYGLPLAAHAKSIGKKSFHIGGGLQLLFGIKGKRWDNPNYGVTEFKEYDGLMANSYASLYNEYWIKPLQVDTPKKASKVDGATYW